MLPRTWAAQGQRQWAGRSAPKGSLPPSRADCASSQGCLQSAAAAHRDGTGSDLMCKAERATYSQRVRPMQSGSLQGSSVMCPDPWSKRAGLPQVRAGQEWPDHHKSVGICNCELGGGAVAAPAHASQTMWKTCPMQSGNLQGLNSAKSADLAGSFPCISSGWQQSKQDWGAPAVTGESV